MLLPVLKDNWKLYLVLTVAFGLLVMWGCWELWRPTPRQPEVYHPAVQQADGSVVLETKPDPTAKPAHAVPKGAKVERTASVTVQPTATVTSPVVHGGYYNYSSSQPVAATPCPPVTVDLSLVRMPDQSHRVIASSPDGTVVGGVDIPVENAAPPPAPKLWAAGIAVDPLRRTGGVFVDRDLGFLRLGVQVNQRELGGLPDQLWVKAGIRW